MARAIKELHPAKWFVSYVDDEGVEARVEMPGEREAFLKAAELAAFDDLYDIRQVRVRHAGRTYYYAGWQPGMLIEFVTILGVVVYSGYFPRWDH